MRDCIKRLVETSGNLWTPKEAKKFLDDMNTLASKISRMSDGTMSFDEAMKDATLKAMYDKKLELTRKSQKQLLNDKIFQNFESYAAASGLERDRAAVAFFRGTVDDAFGGKNSVAAQVSSIIDSYMGGVSNRLKKTGADKYIAAPGMNKMVEIEIAILNGDTSVPPTGNKAARDIAAAFNDTLEELRVRLNDHGAYIKERKGYQGLQSHSESRIKSAGFEKWRDVIKPLLDFKRMDVLPEDADKYLKEAFDQITDGTYEAVGNGLDISKKMSQPRQLVFQTGKWVEYNKAFGKGDYMVGLFHQVETRSRQLMLLKNLGTNPENMKERIKAGLSDDAKKKIDFAYSVASGEHFRPVNKTMATVGHSIRLWETFKNLGGAAFASFPDIGNMGVRLQINGVPWIESVTKSYSAPFRTLFRSQNKKELASMFGVAQRAYITRLIGTFNDSEYVPGVLSKAADKYFRLNLMRWWSEDAMQTSAVETLSHHIGLQAGKSFKDLPADLQHTWKHYGITEADWVKMQDAIVKMEDGLDYLTTENIKDFDVRDKFITYMHDQVSYVTSESDARTRAGTSWGLRPGTLEGEAVRMLMQFKSFTVNQLMRNYGDIIYGGRGKGKATKLMLNLGINSMILAGVSQYVINTLRGQTTEFNDEFARNAFVRGGFGGIISDVSINYALQGYKYAPYSQYLAGPLIGDASKVMENLSKGKPDRALDPLIGKLPGQNLFFMPALLYIAGNDMINAVDPQWINRVQKHRIKSGKDYFVSPTLSQDMK